MTRKFVGIMGKAGAGKDTVRALLEKEYGYTGYAFADPIRTMVGSLFDSCGLPKEYMHERDLKEVPIPQIGVSYRQMMQKLGTEWGRHLNPQLWVQLVASKVASDWSDSFSPMTGVISDLRFKNEAEWLRSIGADIWLVYRPGLAGVAPHISEKEMEGIEPDVVIYNDMGIEQLHNKVRVLMGTP